MNKKIKIKLKKDCIPENNNTFLDKTNKKIRIAQKDRKPTIMKCGLFCVKYISERNKNKFPKRY